ncbi:MULTISPECIES: hypothetical protein [unclassified Cetobacterium]|uniref:hypothetical protein n=1 Tax=unclassified Cetobacterium TaxID=2630983 RepID=UPI000645FA8B|nr:MULTISPECIES: hypothetical protein [unclassified Cetobacterium]
MIGGLFRSKKLIEAEKNQKLLESEIKKLSMELVKKDGFLKCKNDLFISKENMSKNTFDWEKMGDELKKYHEENLLLKKELEKITKILNLKDSRVRYRIKINKFLFEARFNEEVKNFKLNNVNYAQQLNVELIENLVDDSKIKNEILKRYENFINEIMLWELKTNLIKGEKITVVYSKSRKLINVLNEKSVSYMGDLNIDILNQLSEDSFTNEEIDGFKRIFEEYNKEYLIKKEPKF